MSKTLCELDKKKSGKYKDKNGRYECSGCGQRVGEKKRVCRPVKI